MPPDNKICNICLENCENLRSTDEIDADNVKFIIKLSFCVPELEWTGESYQLCPHCAQKLNLIYEFRKLCLKSFGRIKSEQQIERFDSVLDNQPEYSDNDDKQGIICNEDDNLDDTSRYNKENVEIASRVSNSLLNKKFKTNRLNSFTCKLSSQNKADPKSEDPQELTCFSCNKSFNDKDVLVQHLKDLHSDVKNGGECETNKTKVKRKRKSLQEQIYKCTICATVFSTKYLLSRHVRNVHATEKRHNCDICGHKFASPVYLSAHKRYHSGERPHICSFCGKGFITASDLYHHEKIHANKRSYKCDKCPKAFNTSSDLHKHNICVHMDRNEWKYVCSFCNKRFPLKTNMDTHVKIHTGEKNFPCHLCEKRFINKSVLLRHIMTHSNVRSFQCSVCSQEYKYQKSLDIHMTTSHGIGNAKIPERSKKYICHICPKSYYANKLQKHIRSHTMND